MDEATEDGNLEDSEIAPPRNMEKCMTQPEQPTQKTDVTAERLKSFVERIERLLDEKKGIADDIKDVFLEAKSTGSTLSSCARSSSFGRWKHMIGRSMRNCSRYISKLWEWLHDTRRPKTPVLGHGASHYLCWPR